jgi:CxxC-x17-CxxC domain-containing protein
VPDNIKDVSENITNEILGCEICGKNYKIVEEELKFYRRMNLPIQVKCHDCRHKTRFNMRNARHLYKRTCQKCGTEIETTYPPEDTKIVYCEKCYVQSTD